MAARYCKLILAVLTWSLATSALAATPTAAERAKIRAAESELNKAAHLYRAQKYEQAAEPLTAAQGLIAELAESKTAAQATTTLRARMVRARELLTEKGVHLRPLAEEIAGPAADTTGKVSFSKQVAPLLVERCGRCHIRATKGGLSMASYAALAKGSKTGSVVVAGKSKTSRVVELAASGDMPRGGPQLSADELSLLVRWIDEGAKFDGKDPAAPLAKTSEKQPPAAGEGLTVTQATGKEEIRFARDIGPVLAAQCIDCHNVRIRRGELALETFKELLKGGESGPILVPGKPAESMLIQKLRGKSGERMPLEKPALAEAVIARFEKWVEEGAPFDGPDAAEPLVDLVARVHVETSTHEELLRERSELAAKNWRLMLPDARTSKAETKNFLLYGNAGDMSLDQISRTAEEVVAKLTKLLKLPASEPFVKGRLTIYIFEKRYDYGEIGVMVEKRDIPVDWQGHWRFAPPDAYVCLLLPTQAQSSLAGLVAQELAGAHVASLGSVPRWFAEGSARALAAKIDPKDPRLKRWDDDALSAIAQSSKVDDFLTGALPPEQSNVLAYSFVRFLMSKPGPYQATLAALRDGAPFNQAFVRNFGGTPNQLAVVWAHSKPGKRGR